MLKLMLAWTPAAAAAGEQFGRVAMPGTIYKWKRCSETDRNGRVERGSGKRCNTRSVHKKCPCVHPFSKAARIVMLNADDSFRGKLPDQQVVL